MATLPKPTHNSNDDSHGTYLKAGMLKQSVTTVIDDRKASKNATENGPTLGNFGKVDVPFSIDSRRFIHSLSPNSPDYRDACAVLGPNAAEWVGATIMLTESPTLRQISMRVISAPNVEVATPKKR